MKQLPLILLLAIAASTHGQSSLVKKYRIADSLLHLSQLSEAWRILKDIEPVCDQHDTLYRYILWSYTGVTSRLEMQYRLKEKFDSSVYYGLEALRLIDKSAVYYDSTYGDRKYWMYKNLVVSSFGLGKHDQAKQYQDLLYEAYKEKRLPEGIDEYYNFTFFTWQDKNVWGYEWYPEPGDPETKGSYSKIVYYVYSTHADGSDKDQLYRLHVLRFNKTANSTKSDYVLTKQLEKASHEVSGTFYAYTYNKKIDYAKLQYDIKQVLKENYYPDTRTSTAKN